MSNINYSENNNYPSNFIPKGIYNKSNPNNNYNNDIKDLLGNFSNNFNIEQPINNRFHPLDINVSRQIFQPAFNETLHSNNAPNTNLPFSLNDPYAPNRGSNLNIASPNKQITPYNEFDLIKDEMNELFKTINDKSNSRISNKRIVNNNDVDYEYDNNNNIGLPTKRINDYNPDDKFFFLDKNVLGVSQNIFEYVIYINSANRNTITYPSAYNYQILFNPAHGDQGYISRVFENIKYINLKSVITPRKYLVKIIPSFLITTNTSDYYLFTNIFLSSNINTQVVIYNEFQDSFIYDGNTFYFKYFKSIISSTSFYLSTYEIFLDPDYNKKINIQIGNATNKQIIDTFLLTASETAGLQNISGSNYTFNSPILKNTNFWVLIDKTGNKIKFSKFSNIFNEIIDTVFELSYNFIININPNPTKFNIITTNTLYLSNFYYDSIFNKIVSNIAHSYTRYNGYYNDIYPYTYIKILSNNTYYYLYFSIHPNININTFNNWLLNGINSNTLFKNSSSSVGSLTITVKTPTNIILQDSETNLYDFDYSLSNPFININQYNLSDESLENDRYLLLNIKEIDTNYEYSTDDDVNKAFSILFPDYINGDYYYLDTTYHEKLFDHGKLGNVNKMTIQFKNSFGNDILSNYNNIIDYDITTLNAECICLTNPNTGIKDRNYQCSHSYLRHPTFEKLQTTLIFKFGIIEGQQNIQHI